MAVSGRCLLYQHENLTLIPSAHVHSSEETLGLPGLASLRSIDRLSHLSFLLSQGLLTSGIAPGPSHR